MNNFPFKKVLTISPHTDDVELGCGGLVSKLIKNKIDVYYLALSDCRDTLANTPFEENTLYKECKGALKKLGVGSEKVSIQHFTNKRFTQESTEIYNLIEQFKNNINPDLVIIPDVNDTHQDHSTVAKQAIAVFRRSTSILSYEQTWNSIDFLPNLFIKLSEKELKIKLQALGMYKTQTYFKRPYFSENFIRGLAIARGMHINAPYAEAFKIVKFIL